MAERPDRVWIETPTESEALCVLGALADYDAELLRVGDTFRIAIAVDRPFDSVLRALQRSVRNCLAQNGIESVVLHVRGEQLTLHAGAA